MWNVCPNWLTCCNKRTNVEFWKRKYHSLYQEHLAYILSDLCVDCQRRRDNAGNGGCYEVCNECTRKIKTIAILRRELAENDERIRYWIDCYETASSQVSEFPDTKFAVDGCMK